MTSEITFPEEYADSTTTKYRSPEGNVFVTIDYIYRRIGAGPHYNPEIVRVHTCAGKHGTAGFAAAEAISRLVTELLTVQDGFGNSPRWVASHLLGLTHGDTNRLAYDADSIPDAIGKALCSFSPTE